jgi:hypothetical protein
MHLPVKQAATVAAALALLGLGATAQAATTSAGRHAPEAATAARSPVAHRPAGGVRPLPDCAATFAPKVGSARGRTCIRKLSALAARTARVTPFCTAYYYENGPFGSVAWSNGWGVCVSSLGNYTVPFGLDNQASSFETVCPANFYVNAPGTFPGSGAAGNTRGSFPWGAVPNDSLSGIQIVNCRLA